MILEIMYILAGIVSIITGIYAFLDKAHTARIGTALFWIIFGVIFIFGSYMNYTLVGILLFVMGALTITKQVRLGSQTNSDEQYRQEKAQNIGNNIFIPALSMGVLTFLIARFSNLGGLESLGISCLISLVLTLFYTKEKPKYIPYDSSRLLQQMGPSVILPQLLGALGALFAYAGVGEVISTLMGNIIPVGNHLTGVILYCVSMALFTMIMGNAFAAFSVITAGIGVPFVIALGANPVVVGALGLTAGYCGTLMTPMAANFNIIPATILEMQNKNDVIKAQFPIAVAMLISHIVLMYFWAF